MLFGPLKSEADPFPVAYFIAKFTLGILGRATAIWMSGCLNGCLDV